MYSLAALALHPDGVRGRHDAIALRLGAIAFGDVVVLQSAIGGGHVRLRHLGRHGRLFHGEELDVQHDLAVGRNAAVALLAKGQLCGDRHLGSAAGFHQRQAFFPAGEQLIAAHDGFYRLARFLAVNHLRAVRQREHEVHGQYIAVLRRASVAGYLLQVLYTVGGCFGAFKRDAGGSGGPLISGTSVGSSSSGMGVAAWQAARAVVRIIRIDTAIQRVFLFTICSYEIIRPRRQTTGAY